MLTGSVPNLASSEDDRVLGLDGAVQGVEDALLVGFFEQVVGDEQGLGVFVGGGGETALQFDSRVGLLRCERDWLCHAISPWLSGVSSYGSAFPSLKSETWGTQDYAFLVSIWTRRSAPLVPGTE